jgi:dTDP-4-amino-4,6-dideoxygalactose transaminase
MYHINKPYLPDIKKYKKYIDGIYENNWLTNNGQLVQELEARLCDYLGVSNLVLVSSGTVALEIAYHLLKIDGKVITTPYSFVATTSSLVWNGITPEFVDIDPKTLNLDVDQLAEMDLDKIDALVPVHLFGNPCEVEEIKKLSSKHDIKVIYDAAHAMAVKFRGRSILEYGDISTLSLHATKICHAVEGGALVINDGKLCEQARRLINFGYDDNDNILEVGINAKMSEFHAAMGLAVLDDMELILEKRFSLYQIYRKALDDKIEFQEISKDTEWNYSYMPVIFSTEKQLSDCVSALNSHNIFPRRYFNPALDTLDYINSSAPMTTASDMASRVLCLPLYFDLEANVVEKISRIICECQH